MLKRMLSVLLIFGILASGAFCAHAGVLTKKEQYDACVKDLAAYLNDEYTVDLEKLQTSFSRLGSYEHSVSFNLYIRVLTGVESGDYSYVTASINMLRRSPAFEAYLAEKESFGSIDALESYALGRSAEAEGKHEEAMQHYEKADNFFDSYERLTTLQFTAYEAQYQKAYEAYMSDTYEGYLEASKLFKELAEQNYKDSVDLMNASITYAELLKPCEHEWRAATCLQPKICALCGETEGKPSEHTWTHATCLQPKTCSMCGLTEGKTAEHNWLEATCEKAKTCSVCGKTEGTVIGHDWIAATCTSPKTCKNCATTQGRALDHNWKAATCTSPKTCTRCGLTSGSKLSHSWKAATCTEPKTCKNCAATQGSALDHNWIAATCTEPKTCKNCAATQGSALNHNWKAATCTAPKTCSKCGTTTGSAKGHNWQPATYSKPETCSVCQITRGKALTLEYKVGDIIKLGAYEQDNNTGNGKEPIEWIVLEIENKNLLLLSKYGLDAKPINDKYTIVTWENCTLRDWLNRDFLNSAFTNEEKEAILLTNVKNSHDYEFDTIIWGNDTRDKLFLLSEVQVDNYLGNETFYNEQRRIAPTEYAKANGAYVSSVHLTLDGKASGEWWLRSFVPSFFSDHLNAHRIMSSGSSDSCAVNLEFLCVRPAMWVNKESLSY